MSQNRKKAIKQLVKNWHRCINKQTGSIYITALLTYKYISILETAFTALPVNLNCYFLNRLYGDSGFITPALMFDHLQKQQIVPLITF